MCRQYVLKSLKLHQEILENHCVCIHFTIFENCTCGYNAFCDVKWIVSLVCLSIKDAKEEKIDCAGDLGGEVNVIGAVDALPIWPKKKKKQSQL